MFTTKSLAIDPLIEAAVQYASQMELVVDDILSDQENEEHKDGEEENYSMVGDNHSWIWALMLIERRR